MRGPWRTLGAMDDRRLAPLVGVGVAVSIIAACSAFEGLKVDDSRVSASKDGEACVLVKPKLAPSVPIMPPPGTEFVVAVTSIDLGEPRPDGTIPDFSTVGFDLDNTCTTSIKAGTCRKPTWPTEANLDGPGGRDNAF